MSTTASAPPESTPIADAPQLVIPSRSTPAGSGWDWIVGGWKLFARAPLMWILSMVLVFICFVAIGLIPILGGIAAQILQPVVIAGFIVASHSLARGGDFDLEHLLAGFKHQFGNLAMVGLLFFAGGVLIFLVFLAFVFLSIGTAFLAGGAENIMQTIMASGVTFLVGILITLALLVPLAAAFWFAPALVIMHGMAPVAAMRESFVACFRNFVPFLVYGLVFLVLAILAAIPFGLGFLVLVPMTMASIYVSYREIFTEEGPVVPAKPTFA